MGRSATTANRESEYHIRVTNVKKETLDTGWMREGTIIVGCSIVRRSLNSGNGGKRKATTSRRLRLQKCLLLEGQAQHRLRAPAVTELIVLELAYGWPTPAELPRVKSP